MRRPKFTVRWLMALVAAFSLILAGEMMRRRWAPGSRSRVEKSWYHKAKASAARGGIYIDGFNAPPRPRPVTFKHDQSSAWYHDQMQKKWEKGARYPWLSVEPDAMTDPDAHRRGSGWAACHCSWCTEWFNAGGR